MAIILGLLVLFFYIVILKQIQDLIHGYQYTIRGRILSKWVRKDKRDSSYQKIDIILAKSNKIITKELTEQYYNQAQIDDEIEIIYLKYSDLILSYKVLKSKISFSQNIYYQSNTIFFVDEEPFLKAEIKSAIKKLFQYFFGVALILFTNIYFFHNLLPFSVDFYDTNNYIIFGYVIISIGFLVNLFIKIRHLSLDLWSSNKSFFIGNVINKSTQSTYERELYNISVYSDILAKEVLFKEVKQENFDKIDIGKKVKVEYLKRSKLILNITNLR